jgi:hypothetical protein
MSNIFTDAKRRPSIFGEILLKKVAEVSDEKDEPKFFK